MAVVAADFYAPAGELTASLFPGETLATNVTAWLAHFAIDIGRWPKLAAHNARVANRPAVQAARRAEKDPGKA